MSIAGFVGKWADTDRVAFHFEGQTTTYADLAAAIEMTARGLTAAGVAARDRVGFCGLNRVEVFEVFFACARIGAIFLPFNNRLTASELRTQIEDSSPTLLVATDGFHELLGQASERAVRDLDTEPFAVRPFEALPFEALPGDQELTEVAPSGETTVLMVYTSGTTGQPKGAMLSHDAIVHTILNGIDHQQLTGEDRIVAPLPTFHVGGLNIQTLPTLFVGGQVLLQRRFDPAGVLELITQHRATQTLLVPAMLAAVAAQPSFATTDWSSMRGINSGSSVVPDAVMQPFFEIGVPVGQVYGTTETGPTAIVLSYDDAHKKMGSCGKPAAHTEVRIVGTAGEDAVEDQPGELWLRGANIFTGYWRNAEATERAFAPGGWFRTGDVGYRDGDGFIMISDRLTDVLISGGENVYPAEIEPALLLHPSISEVAVIGEADARWGEVPVAVAVLADGATLTIDELRAWCDDRLARYKQPRVLRCVDVLPRTALGKVKKHELRH